MGMSRLAELVGRMFPGRADRARPAKLHHLWSIGIYRGRTPRDLRPAVDVANPVLTRAQVTDVPALFVADPFMISHGGGWYMFFEVMNGRTGKGEIGMASSSDGIRWRYEKIVLSEPFHLSYPFVFEWDGTCYMLPECHQTGTVRLYQARVFPASWTYCATLLQGERFADASVLRYEDRWWLFTETAPDLRHDTLRLYYSASLDGAWTEHPASPIVRGNPHLARPGGRLLQDREQLYRFAQDCYPAYGTRVRTLRIAELSPTHYREEEIDANRALGPSGSDWNRSGMHHVDAHCRAPEDWLACVDGWTAAPMDEYMRPVRRP